MEGKMTLEKLANLHEEDHQVHPVKVRGYTYNIYIYVIIYIYICLESGMFFV